MGKNVYCCMSGHGDIALLNDPSFVYINKTKTVNKYGIPDDKIKMKVLGFPADILIDLSRGKCYTLKLLMLQHPSTFKVGERLGDESLYDFSIIMKGGERTSDLFENLLFYLQSIRSK
ncbi:MAG: hypothetical protein PHX50_06835 [Massilibacteroides sp.]|nr:hypothetical protein [Massilibacteroides sp.]